MRPCSFFLPDLSRKMWGQLLQVAGQALVPTIATWSTVSSSRCEALSYAVGFCLLGIVVPRPGLLSC